MAVMCFLGAVVVAAQFIVSLEPKTVQAFDAYLQGVDKAMAGRSAGRTEGVTANSAGSHVPHGMLHDWTAVAFVPGGKKAKAVAVLEDFGRHASIYPEVTEGRVVKREGSTVIGYHRLRKKKVLEVTMDVTYRLEVLASTATKYASRSAAVEISEVDGAGTGNEKRLAPGRDHGFLWRLQTYWLVEETEKGVWLEVRSVSLTRDTPMGVGWIVKPIVRDLPREALEGLMAATKKALEN